ncbi:MAG: type I 3-dehydroquinate dehydratase, partial [Candidatus Cloacimonadales bacterium]
MIILSLPIDQSAQIIDLPSSCQHLELRLDYLKKPTSFPISKLRSEQIITIRDQAEAGKNFCPLSSKLAFYQKAIARKNCLVDLEYRNYSAEIPATNLILSYHDFSQNFDLPQLQALIQASNRLKAKYLKIAVNINSYQQFTLLANLIKQANKPVILVGMGKLGKLSRLLYKHLGSAATYIGLAAKPTASGQLSLQEAELFSLSAIEPTTSLGGLIGGEQVYHSLGMKYYNQLFQQKAFNARYLPWFVDDFSDFWQWLLSHKTLFYGFSITMPYKSEIACRLGL